MIAFYNHVIDQHRAARSAAGYGDSKVISNLPSKRSRDQANPVRRRMKIYSPGGVVCCC